MIKSSSHKTASKKTFQGNHGKWVEKRTRTEILVCVCGSRYIKTRKDQVLCVRCMYHPKPAIV